MLDAGRAVSEGERVVMSTRPGEGICEGPAEVELTTVEHAAGVGLIGLD